MRKFARSIGSEGKSQGQQERTVSVLIWPYCSRCLGTRSLGTLLATILGFEGYLSEAGQPVSPWHGASLHGGEPKIANSELLTAGNPTV